MCGLVPTTLLKRSRKAVGEPKPVWAAIRSTGYVVVSSRCCARRTRARCSHCKGVVPVCSRKRRFRVRVLMPACAAMSARVRSSRSACSSSQRSTGSIVAPAGAGGWAWTMNWACPPSRSRGITHIRAVCAATAEPWSLRIMCRHMSMAAAAPAEVRNRPLSTYRTFGSTVTFGYLAARSWAAIQCVVARSPSSRPVAAKRNAPTQIEAIRVPFAAAAHSASATPGGNGRVGSAVPGRMIVSASASASSPYGARTLNGPAPTSSPAVTEQTRTRYASRPSGSRAQPKVSIGAERSNGMTPSRASTATVCMVRA